jgi:circadian clock protein KaiB
MADQDKVSKGNGAETYVLRLFISGASPNSIRAVENTKSICEEHLADNYSLEIIDIHQQPHLAQDQDVIAVPLLLKLSPYPKRKMIGDMSDTQRVLKGLGLTANA